MPAPHPILFARLRLAQYGPDIAMPDLRHELARCPHSHNMSNPCHTTSAAHGARICQRWFDRPTFPQRHGLKNPRPVQPSGAVSLGGGAQTPR